MNDHEAIATLIPIVQTSIEVGEQQQRWIMVLLATCSALISAQPNKDVLRTTFARVWRALDGPAKAANWSEQDKGAMREALGPIADELFSTK